MFSPIINQTECVNVKMFTFCLVAPPGSKDETLDASTRCKGQTTKEEFSQLSNTELCIFWGVTELKVKKAMCCSYTMCCY